MKPIPTIAELYNDLATQLQNELGLTDAQLKMALNAMAAVLAAQLKVAYLYLQDVEDNMFADKADSAANGGTLERQGLIRLNRLPFPASEGYYTTQVTGTAGAILRAELTFQSTDQSNAPGNLYILDDEYEIPVSGTGSVTLRALSAGVDYLLFVGDRLAVTEPVLGLNNQVTVTAIADAPEEGETTEQYRSVVLDSYLLEPQGGAKTDYRIWAADAQGVRKVYPYVKNGEAGTVQVYVEALTANSTDGHGTPDATLLENVEEVINFDPDETRPLDERGRIPVGVPLEVLPINPQPVDIIITGLQTNTADIRANILASITNYLYTVRPYVAAADLPRDKNDLLSAIKLQSVVNDTVGSANVFLGFVMYVNGVQATNYTFALANIPYLRNITYNN